MPPISTHMHFGKFFIENSYAQTDIHSFILGLVSPDTFEDDEDFEEFHCLDEDGNIDVREFFEKFNFADLNNQQKSFVLGYYSHLWLDEYYKFNASKLVVHNSIDLNDDELSAAVKNIVRYYDRKTTGNFYDSVKNTMAEFEVTINLKELSHVSIKKAKDKLAAYFNEPVPKDIYRDLIDEKEYMDFIGKSCSKFIKSSM